MKITKHHSAEQAYVTNYSHHKLKKKWDDFELRTSVSLSETLFFCLDLAVMKYKDESEK